MYHIKIYSFSLRCSSPWWKFRHHIFTGYVRHNLEVFVRLIEYAEPCRHHLLSVLIIYLLNVHLNYILHLILGLAIWNSLRAHRTTIP
jgi:hypothetical protein